MKRTMGWSLGFVAVLTGAACSSPSSHGDEEAATAQALSQPTFADGSRWEYVVDTSGAPIQATQFNDVKVYLTPEQAPSILLVSQSDRGSLLYRRAPTGAWGTFDVLAEYNTLAGLTGADRADEAADTHLSFVPGTKQVWLTASVVFTQTKGKAKMLLRSNDLGATWDRATFAELEPPLHGTHEGKVLCTAENACVYLGLQDPTDGLRAAGTTYKVWNGQWCPAVNLPGQTGYLGQMSFAWSGGQLALGKVKDVVTALGGIPADVMRVSAQINGCDLTIGETSTLLTRDLAVTAFGASSNFPYQGVGLTAAAPPSETRATWTALDDQRTGILRLVSERPSTRTVLATVDLVPPRGTFFASPTMAYDHEAKRFVLFYYALSTENLGTSKYDVCARTIAADGNTWSGELCVARGVPFKSPTTNPQTKSYGGLFDNYLFGDAKGGKAAAAYPTDCTKTGDPTTETCKLRLWHTL